MALLLVGVVARLVPFLQRRLWWLDEAMILLNVGRRSFGELAAPLVYDQVAPVSWLWLIKGMTLVLGMHEWVTRLPALVAGVALIWMVWKTGRKLVGEPSALMAMALIAASPVLIYFANETKPYALDALVSIGLLGLAAGIAARPDDDRAWRRFGLGGAVAVLCSLPAAPFLAGLGGALVVISPRPALRRLIPWGVVWLVLFLPPWLLLYGPGSSSPLMQDFWADAIFAAGTPGMVARARFAYGEFVYGLLPSLAIVGVPATLMLLWGTRVLPRTIAALLIGPIAVAVLLFLVDRLPAATRLWIYLVPSLALVIGAGLADLHTRLSRWRAWAAGCLPVAVGAVVILGLYRGVPGKDYLPGRRLVSAATERTTAGTVYVSAYAALPWLMYTTDWDSPDTARLDWYARHASWGGEAFHNAPPRGRPISETAGAGLVWSSGERREILGLSSGIQYRARVRVLTLEPDSGWAAREARRLRDLGALRLHTLQMSGVRSELTRFRMALVGTGAAVTVVDSAARGVLLEVQFPRVSPTVSVP